MLECASLVEPEEDCPGSNSIVPEATCPPLFFFLLRVVGAGGEVGALREIVLGRPRGALPFKSLSQPIQFVSLGAAGTVGVRRMCRLTATF